MATFSYHQQHHGVEHSKPSRIQVTMLVTENLAKLHVHVQFIINTYNCIVLHCIV